MYKEKFLLSELTDLYIWLANSKKALSAEEQKELLDNVAHGKELFMSLQELLKTNVSLDNKEAVSDLIVSIHVKLMGIINYLDDIDDVGAKILRKSTQ